MPRRALAAIRAFRSERDFSAPAGSVSLKSAVSEWATPFSVIFRFTVSSAWTVSVRVCSASTGFVRIWSAVAWNVPSGRRSEATRTSVVMVSISLRATRAWNSAHVITLPAWSVTAVFATTLNSMPFSFTLEFVTSRSSSSDDMLREDDRSERMRIWEAVRTPPIST